MKPDPSEYTELENEYGEESEFEALQEQADQEACQGKGQTLCELCHQNKLRIDKMEATIGEYYILACQVSKENCKTLNRRIEKLEQLVNDSYLLAVPLHETTEITELREQVSELQRKTIALQRWTTLAALELKEKEKPVSKDFEPPRTKEQRTKEEHYRKLQAEFDSPYGCCTPDLKSSQTTEPRNCGNCRYWLAITEEPGTPPFQGICQRYPHPQVHHNKTDWCGEHKLR